MNQSENMHYMNVFAVTFPEFSEHYKSCIDSVSHGFCIQ